MTEGSVSPQLQAPPRLVRSDHCLSVANASLPQDRVEDPNQIISSPSLLLSTSDETVSKYLNNAVDAMKRFEEFLISWQTGSRTSRVYVHLKDHVTDGLGDMGLRD